jgi:hypothetical protein
MGLGLVFDQVFFSESRSCKAKVDYLDVEILIDEYILWL